MKQLLFPIFLLATISGPLSAQNSIPSKDVLLKARITPLHRQTVSGGPASSGGPTVSGSQTASGYVYSLGDTSLVLTRESRFLRLSDTIIADGVRFRYADLSTVVLHKKGVIGRSTLIGFCIGAGVGALIGLASGDDDPNKSFLAYSAGEKAVGGAVLVGGTGAIVGLIIGVAAHKTFYIHGKKERYEKMRARMIARLGL